MFIAVAVSMIGSMSVSLIVYVFVSFEEFDVHVPCTVSEIEAMEGGRIRFCFRVCIRGFVCVRFLGLDRRYQINIKR